MHAAPPPAPGRRGRAGRAAGPRPCGSRECPGPTSRRAADGGPGRRGRRRGSARACVSSQRLRLRSRRARSSQLRRCSRSSVGGAPLVGGEVLDAPPDVLDLGVDQPQLTRQTRALTDPGGRVEQRLVVGGRGVDRAADAAAAQDPPGLVGLGDSRVGDAGQARAQPDVRRARGLRLDRTDPSDRLHDRVGAGAVDLGELPGQAEPAQLVEVVGRHAPRLGAVTDTPTGPTPACHDDGHADRPARRPRRAARAWARTGRAGWTGCRPSSSGSSRSGS